MELSKELPEVVSVLQNTNKAFSLNLVARKAANYLKKRNPRETLLKYRLAQLLSQIHFSPSYLFGLLGIMCLMVHLYRNDLVYFYNDSYNLCFAPSFMKYWPVD